MATWYFSCIEDWQSQLENSEGWWQSFDLPDGPYIRGTQSVEGMRSRITWYPIRLRSSAGTIRNFTRVTIC
jgi:hypothetical protein